MEAHEFQNTLTGKRVVIIGASSGMGLALSRACATLGAHVIMASRSREKLEVAQKTVTGKTELQAVDMLDETSVNTFFEGVDYYAVNQVLIPQILPKTSIFVIFGQKSEYHD